MYIDKSLGNRYLMSRCPYHADTREGSMTAQLTGSHRGTGGRIQIPEMWLQALLPFPAPLPEHPGELSCRLHQYRNSALISQMSVCGEISGVGDSWGIISIYIYL